MHSYPLQGRAGERVGGRRSRSLAKGTIKVLLVVLASGLAAVAVVATLTDGTLSDIGTSRDAPAREASGAGATATTSWTPGARPAAEPRTHEASGPERYLVRAGDTLWGIAACRYEDASAAMQRIKRRNRLQRDTLLAGETLVLPTAGRRTAGPRVDEMCPASEATTQTAAAAP